MRHVTLLIILGIIIQNGAETELPSYIVPCSASDEKCLKNIVQTLEPHLVEGIKEFQLPSIVPLHLPDFNYSKNISLDLDYSIALTNIQLDQVNDYKVSNISIDLDHLKFLLVLTFPQVTLTADEKVSGKAFGLEANWDRTGRINIKNLIINFSLDGTEIRKGGKRYVNWRRNKVDISTGSIRFDVEDPWDDKQLRTNLVQKVDENREYVNREARFLVKNTLAEYIFNIINVVHDTFPIDALYANQ